MSSIDLEKPLTEIFKTVSPALRQMLTTAFKLSANTPDKELIETLSGLVDRDKLTQERDDLLYQLAKLKVDKAIKDGVVLSAQERLLYIKLTSKNEETLESTISLLYEGQRNKLELDELTKLSGRELYLSGKLERLKELNEEHFQLKYRELHGKNYVHTSKPSSQRTLAAVENKPSIVVNESAPESQLGELLKLSGQELYMQGKLEQLKGLDIQQFKLKYKEVFKINYPG